MQNKTKQAKYAKKTKYADMHTDFACKKLINSCQCSTSDIKLWMNQAENGPNLAHHVVKAPAIDGQKV